jgi:phosphoadenosine phosphosulfate reductase
MGLPYPSLYDEGFHRIGCVVCPFLFHKNQTNVISHKNRWPGLYKAFEHACHRRWIDQSGKIKDQKHDTFDEWMQADYRGFE